MFTDSLEAILEGRIFLSSNETSTKNLPWNEHPVFSGVALKHFITGKDTDGQFSSHLVRVNNGCEIGKHIHEGKWELHEVIKGRGKCSIENKEIDYYEGVTAIIPPGIPHTVKAGAGDLYILAKFIPALL